MPGPTRQTLAAIAVPPSDVERLLGYRDGAVTPRGRALAAEAVVEAGGLIDAVFAFARAPLEALRASRFLRAVDDAVVCVATIGPRLETRVGRYQDQGDLGRALALDACGSVAVEAVADAAERAIGDGVRARGLRSSRRFSPGYGGWDLSEQRWVLDAIEAGAIGVTLSGAGMMRPRKSVTFAVTVGAEPVEMRSENPCDDCEMETCAYRRETPRHTDLGVTCTTRDEHPSTYCPLGRRNE